MVAFGSLMWRTVGLGEVAGGSVWMERGLLTGKASLEVGLPVARSTSSARTAAPSVVAS